MNTENGEKREKTVKEKSTVMPSVPRAFCLMAIAIRFFSALVSLRAASIFRLTSLCSLSASRRFSASVPMPSSLDTCSSLCKLVIESVPISTWAGEKRTSSQKKKKIPSLPAGSNISMNVITHNYPEKSVFHCWALDRPSGATETFSTCVGGCWVAKPRSNRRMKGRAGLERNFFQTSASRLTRVFRKRREGINTDICFMVSTALTDKLWS